MLEEVQPHHCKEAVRVGRNKLFAVLPAQRRNASLLRHSSARHAHHIVPFDAARHDLISDAYCRPHGRQWSTTCHHPACPHCLRTPSPWQAGSIPGAARMSNFSKTVSTTAQPEQSIMPANGTPAGRLRWLQRGSSFLHRPHSERIARRGLPP